MRLRTLIALVCGLSAAGCEVRPTRPVLQHELNEEAIAANEALAQDPTAQDQVRGGLELLFGTPSNPGYFLIEEWIEDEYDPNFGSYELSDEEWEALVAENERVFAEERALIEAGEFGEVRTPRQAPDFASFWGEILDGWQELRDSIEEGEATEADLAAYVDENQESAELLFAEWYPSLRDSAELYRVQCMHCHGVSGGGDGTTAEFLTPRPRDYRQGQFKFTALDERARPRRADLLNVLHEGVYGTAMPSFKRFSAARLHGLVDYVRLLSIRGETEIRLAADYDPYERLPLEALQSTYLDVWELWNEAADYVIAYEGEVPKATPESIARGKELFEAEDKANCISCHGASGRGDGPSAFERNEEGELVRVEDDWGQPVMVRDLTRGLYRFGHRPIDIYRRIYAGINGTPMPAHAAMKDPEDPSQPLLSEEDLWALVHYVRALPEREAARRVAASASPAPEGTY